MSLINIITINDPAEDILRKKTEEIQAHEYDLAKEISEALFVAIQPHLPAAGLAAPQIGFSKSLFIFSYDRDPKNLEVVINPSYEPESGDIMESWEGCFSVLLARNSWKLAKIPRYKTIRVKYQNLDGDVVEKTLQGFAAKVFQHEYDHLQGIVNISHKDALIKEFESEEEMLDFLKEVKKEDALQYEKPK